MGDGNLLPRTTLKRGPLSLRVETLAVATLQNPRVQGSLQAIGGACETIVGAGITLASEGIAAPAGWVLMVHPPSRRKSSTNFFYYLSFNPTLREGTKRIDFIVRDV